MLATSGLLLRLLLVAGWLASPVVGVSLQEGGFEGGLGANVWLGASAGRCDMVAPASSSSPLVAAEGSLVFASGQNATCVLNQTQPLAGGPWTGSANESVVVTGQVASRASCGSGGNAYFARAELLDVGGAVLASAAVGSEAAPLPLAATDEWVSVALRVLAPAQGGSSATLLRVTLGAVDACANRSVAALPGAAWDDVRASVVVEEEAGAVPPPSSVSPDASASASFLAFVECGPSEVYCYGAVGVAALCLILTMVTLVLCILATRRLRAAKSDAAAAIHPSRQTDLDDIRIDGADAAWYNTMGSSGSGSGGSAAGGAADAAAAAAAAPSPSPAQAPDGGRTSAAAASAGPGANQRDDHYSALRAPGTHPGAAAAATALGLDSATATAAAAAADGDKADDDKDGGGGNADDDDDHMYVDAPRTGRRSSSGRSGGSTRSSSRRGRSSRSRLSSTHRSSKAAEDGRAAAVADAAREAEEAEEAAAELPEISVASPAGGSTPQRQGSGASSRGSAAVQRSRDGGLAPAGGDYSPSSSATSTPGTLRRGPGADDKGYTHDPWADGNGGGGDDGGDELPSATTRGTAAAAAATTTSSSSTPPRRPTHPPSPVFPPTGADSGTDAAEDSSDFYSAMPPMRARLEQQSTAGVSTDASTAGSPGSPSTPSTAHPSTPASARGSIKSSGKKGRSTREVMTLFDVVAGDVIGKGAYGTVYRGTATVHGAKREVAIKQIMTQDEQEAMKELAVLCRLSHARTLQFFGVTRIDGIPGLLLVTQFCEKGALDVVLAASGFQQIPQLGLAQICMQVAQGLAFLHSKNIVHRDLAARNCLVTKDDDVVIADFGLSRFQDSDEVYVSSSAVAVRWAAPEILRRSEVSLASDVWALAMVFTEVFARGQRLPYDEILRNTAVIQAICSGKVPTQEPECPDSFYAIMQQCWQMDRNLRPDAGQAKRDVERAFARLAEEARLEALRHLEEDQDAALYGNADTAAAEARTIMQAERALKRLEESRAEDQRREQEAAAAAEAEEDEEQARQDHHHAQERGGGDDDDNEDDGGDDHDPPRRRPNAPPAEQPPAPPPEYPRDTTYAAPAALRKTMGGGGGRGPMPAPPARGTRQSVVANAVALFNTGSANAPPPPLPTAAPRRPGSGTASQRAAGAAGGAPSSGAAAAGGGEGNDGAASRTASGHLVEQGRSVVRKQLTRGDTKLFRFGDFANPDASRQAAGDTLGRAKQPTRASVPPDWQRQP